jgi:uncharacterized membrane protein YjfL (UPF0719 family)
VPLVVNRFLNSVSQQNLRVTLVLICTVGMLCGFGMALFWNQTVRIGNRHYSLIFYLLFLVVGACSSTSNVTHYIYVSEYTKIETTCLATGMALGSTTAGILGILQGFVLKSYGMSVSYTYGAVALMYIPAIIAVMTMKDTLDESKHKMNGLLTPIDDSESNHHDNTLMDRRGDALRDRVGVSPLSGPYSTIFKLHCLNSMLGYGIVPSLISPICSRFTSSGTVLLLATGIACTLDPMFRSFTVYRALDTMREIVIGTCVLVSLAILLVITLALPHDSSLLNSDGGVGGVYPVLLYVLFGVLFGFINTSVFLYLKHHVHPLDIQEGYRWAGVMSQSGALLGSLISFSLVISGGI